MAKFIETTYDGEKKKVLFSPSISNVEYAGRAGEKGHVHLDMDFGLSVSVNTLELLPKLIKAIQDIQIEG